jgi:hypothetical protein
MRHFLLEELAPLAVTVSSLPSRLQAPRAGPLPIAGPRPSKRLTPLKRRARHAETLAAITRAAETKLIATPLAGREPVHGRRHEAPRCRFLDMELGP